MLPSTLAVPLIETSHITTFGPVALAVADTGIVVAPDSFSSPHADPDTARLPGQCAENSPEIIVPVWFVTRHSKPLHAFGPDDDALDVQVPR